MEPIRGKRKPMSDINVVPYIDVMLVLLIIFMVTAPMLMQGIEVQLPKTAADSITVSTNDPPLIIRWMPSAPTTPRLEMIAPSPWDWVNW